MACGGRSQLAGDSCRCAIRRPVVWAGVVENLCPVGCDQLFEAVMKSKRSLTPLAQSTSLPSSLVPHSNFSVPNYRRLYTLKTFDIYESCTMFGK